MTLTELIKQQEFSSAGHESLLNVIVTSSWVMGELAAAMAPYGITPSQYNVLRILQGSHPDHLTCSDIGERLLDRTPDVTRLLNRLQRSHLISRERSNEDRRVVKVGITPEGTALLRSMEGDMEAVMERLTQHLSEGEHQQLSRCLERLRTDQAP